MRAGDQPLRGVVMLLVSLLLMAIMSALVKLVSARQPLAEIVFFRFATSLLPLMWLLHRRGGIARLHTKQPLQHLIRSLLGVVGLALYFYALGAIPMADAAALTFSAPLFLALLAGMMLGEKVGVSIWAAVVIGFLGMLLIASPQGHGFGPGTLAAIASALTGALVSIWIRRMSAADAPITIAVIYNSFGAATALLVLILVGGSFELDIDTGIMMLIGIIAGAQQYLMTSSFRYAEASFLAPLQYLVLVFAGLVGWLFWDEVPTTAAVVGTVIITVCGVFIVRRQTLHA